MIKVVIDTNIVVSAFGWRGNEYITMQKVMKKEILLIVSLDIVEEYRRVLDYNRLGFSKEEIGDFIDALIEVAVMVQPTISFNTVLEHPADNKFVDAAVESKADYIISGDKHLKILKEYKGIKIVSPREFLNIRHG